MFQEFREAEELSTAFLTDVSLLPTKPLYCRFIDPWVHWSTALPRRRRRWGRICRLWGRLLRRLLALVLLRVDVLGFRLFAPRHGASIGAPGEPRLFALSATNSWSWEIYPPSAGTRMSQ